MTLEEYIAAICAKRGVSRAEFKAEMERRESRPGVCQCTDYASCKGWRFYHEEDFDSKEEYLSSTFEIPS